MRYPVLLLILTFSTLIFAQQLQITYPNDGETFYLGDTVIVSYNADASLAPLRLMFTDDKNSGWTTWYCIARYLEGDPKWTPSTPPSRCKELKPDDSWAHWEAYPWIIDNEVVNRFNNGWVWVRQYEDPANDFSDNPVTINSSTRPGGPITLGGGTSDIRITPKNARQRSNHANCKLSLLHYGGVDAIVIHSPDGAAYYPSGRIAHTVNRHQRTIR